MEMMGATVVKKFTPEVTHVIFKDGKKTTREKAIKKGIHLVSVLWVESCRQSGKHVSEDLFPVVEPEQAVTPLMIGRLKRTKSMQPKAFEEDVQNSADRGDRRRKRKLQAENLTPTAMVFCAETQDPCSPITVNPPLTPHMVPDTPCHEITSPLTKALSYAPVDGHWGRWSSWGACSARCDNGTRVRTRKCDDPSPADSGKPCPEDDEQQEACIIKRCSSGPLDCDFDFVGSCPHWSTKNDNSGKFEWTKGSGATPSSNTGPSADHTTGAGNYLYVEASSPAQEGNKAWLLHDQFPATAGRCLSFWYHMYGASTGTLNVYIVDKDDKSTLGWSKYGDQGNQWNEAKFTLESKLDYKVMFEAVRGASFQGDMALDDIGFTNGPCMEEVGCFQDNEEHRAFPTMLKNLRSAIDWHHLEKIVQKYAMLTKENNYKVFAIQFYGGCWSGESPKVQYDRWGAVDESQCKLGVGGENINAVYRLVP